MLLFWNKAKGNADHDHCGRRQGFDTFVDHQAGSRWTTSAHLGLNQKDSRPADHSQVEISAFTNVMLPKRSILLREQVKHCPRLNFCSSNEQKVGFVMTGRVFFCYSHI